MKVIKRMHLKELRREIFHYSDLTNDVASIESALKKLETYLKDDTKDHPKLQREEHAKYIIGQLIDVGRIREDGREYRPIDEFYQIHFGKYAPSFVSNRVIFQRNEARHDEIATLVQHRAEEQQANIISTLFAPLRYQQQEKLLQTAQPNKPLDTLALCFENLLGDRADKAFAYLKKSLESHPTSFRHSVQESFGDVQRIVPASLTDINALRVNKYHKEPLEVLAA